MQETPGKPVENIVVNDVTPEKQSPDNDDAKGEVKTSTAPLKEVKKTESEFKTPEKTSRPNQSPESEVKENPSIKENSTLLKELNSETEFKTPEKGSNPNQQSDDETNGNDTPKKACTPKGANVKENSTPLKEVKNTETEFKTPEKKSQPNQSVETQGKTMTGFHLKLEQSCDDGMISTTEQARLLIAASKTPSKSANRTPVKQNTPSGKRSIENSPVTPGKHRRVELITLASPKAKRIKQM